MKIDLYKHLIELENGSSNSESTLVKILKLISKEDNDTNIESYMGEEIKDCPLGLYEVFWKSGGSSIAAIGNMHNGVRWIAPCNWTTSEGFDPTERIEGEFINNIKSIVLIKRS